MIIDITQEVFSSRVFPGDPAPERKMVSRIEDGAGCNVTAFSMCAHNGTHVDAPFHFIKNGRAIDEMGLEPFVGNCFVAGHDGKVSREDALGILRSAAEKEAADRILIAGKAELTAEAAKVFAEAGILLYGNESQTVGPEDSPVEVHRILLGAEVVLLEGIILEGVSEGKYFLNAAPLNLGGSDGAPCRAYLMK